MKNDYLPADAYTDPEWFALEQRHIFSATWAYVGLADDLTEPGQYKVVQAGLNSIVILVGKDYRLRAFHNQCRHRGTQLLHPVGKEIKTAITCPYHDWTYDLEGNLLSVPNEEKEFPDLDKSCLGLKKASVDKWRGMLWVHPEEQAPSLQSWFGEAEPYLGPHRPDELVEAKDYRITETIQANWKIVVENYIDHYHLAQLHSGTLNMYDHANAEFGFVGPHFTFWEPLVPEYEAQLDKVTDLPIIDHIPREQMGTWVPMLFPGIGLAESETAWSVFHIIPEAVDRTRVEIRTKIMPMSDWTALSLQTRSGKFWYDRIAGKYSDLPADHPLGSADFMQEDIYVCEQQQRSFESPMFEIGPSAAKGELPVREHQQVVFSYLEPHLKPHLGRLSGKPFAAAKAEDNDQSTGEAEPATMAATLTVNTTDGKVVDVTVKAGQTLLQALKQHPLDVPYSCEGGVCGRCRCQLESGHVHLKHNAVLTSEEVRNGVILTCQAIPETEALAIRY